MKGKVTVSALLLIMCMVARSQSTGIPSFGRNGSHAENHQQSATANCSGAASMPQGDFANALANVKKEGFDETKLNSAEQVAGANCLTTGQIAEICKVFGFEETKLKFAKFAYDHCTEPQNYFKLNNVFGFSSSVDELSKYVQSKQ